MSDGMQQRNNTFRHRVYSVIEKGAGNTAISKSYDIIMLFVIVLSLLPLTTHSSNKIYNYIDVATCLIFIADYILRWLTADIRSNEKGAKPFLRYPFTPMAIIDLLSILPTLSTISPVFKVLRVSRLFRIFRFLKFFRYYEPLQIVVSVIKKQGKTLMSVFIVAVFYILICAMVMFNVEHDPFFNTFFDAVYWSCCTLTTVGYGDIYPVSDLGRFFSMISAVVGIALIALPSGIVTSGYMDELRQRREEQRRKEDDLSE